MEQNKLIPISNNLIQAIYDGQDPVKQKIIKQLAYRYHEILAFTVNDLTLNSVDMSPLELKVKDYGIDKERLIEKAKEMMDLNIQFRFIFPGGSLSEAYGPLFGAIVNTNKRGSVFIEVNKNLIPYMRWSGYDARAFSGGKKYFVGITNIPLNEFRTFGHSYADRINDFINFMNQRYSNIENGVFPMLSLKNIMKMLKIPDVYKAPYKLKSRIFEPALKEIYEKTGSLYIVDIVSSMKKKVDKPESQIRLTRLYCNENNFSHNKSYYSGKLKFIVDYMKKINFPENVISKVIYCLRTEAPLNEMYEDLINMLNSNMNKYKVAQIFKNSILNAKFVTRKDFGELF